MIDEIITQLEKAYFKAWGEIRTSRAMSNMIEGYISACDPVKDAELIKRLEQRKLEYDKINSILAV